jgi:hypothetical protein
MRQAVPFPSFHWEGVMAGLSQAGQVLASGREQFWRAKQAEFAASGLSIRAFCRRESLVESAFYFWRREIAVRDAKVAVAGKKITKASKPVRPAFVPVVAAQTSSFTHEGLAIELRGGRVLRMPGNMLWSEVAQLIHALEAEDRR